MSLQTYPDAVAAARACARRIASLLAEALKTQDRAAIALSGGHTPLLLFEALAESGFAWDRVHFFWADERCVPPGNPESNFRLAEQSLFAAARVPAGNVHRIEGELEPPRAAANYVEEIRRFFSLEAGQFPAFDIMQLGMGADGHTASLFPGSPALEDRTSIAAPVYAPQFHQWRVTLMPGALLAARHTVFLVTGADKAGTLRQVLDGVDDPHRYPAQLISRHGRNVEWFLDEPAAQNANMIR